MNESTKIIEHQPAIPDDIIDVLSSNGIARDTLLLKKVSVERLCQILMEGERSIDDLCEIFGVSRYAMVRELNQSDILGTIATYMRVGIIQDIKLYGNTKTVEGHDGELVNVPDLDSIKLADMVIKKKIEIANNFSPIKAEKDNEVNHQDINIISVNPDAEDRAVDLYEHPEGFVENNKEDSASKEEAERTINNLKDFIDGDTEGDDEPFFDL